MRKFLLMSKVTLFCLLCSYSLESFSQALAANYPQMSKDKSQAAKPMFGKYLEIPVKGRVIGEDGSGLPGVSVVVKGTTIGTVTDVDGNYSLNVPDENSVLSFSFIGYLTEEVTVGSQTTIDINLALDVTSLSEVVVTGYQTQNRRSITGAVSTVAAKDLVAIPQGNVEQQLQGRVAGVTVITSGAPGAASQVRVRGFGSFTGNQPLYIIDGVPYNGAANISWLNSNDIETTTILKDAATASVYGSRAAAGVIVYTTKKGKAGKFNVTYDGSYGTQVPGKSYDILNPTEQMEATRQAFVNSGTSTEDFDHFQYGQNGDWQLPDYILVGDLYGVRQSDITGTPRPGYETAAAKFNTPVNYDFSKGGIYQIYGANKSGTDWFDELTNPAPIQNHTLGLSGGSETARYYVGLGHYNQQGIVKHSYFNRTSLRANTEFNIKNRVRIGENMTFVFRKDPGFNNLNEGSALSHAYRMNPLIPVYDVTGTGYAGTFAKGFNNPRNPIAIQDRNKDNSANALTLFGNVYGEVDILKGLTFRSSFGGYMNYFQGQGITQREYENSENIGTVQIFESFANFNGWTFTNTLNFTKEFGIHEINALGGIESIHDGFGRQVNASGVSPFTISLPYRSVNTTQSSGRGAFSSGAPGTRLYSLFVKADYTLNRKYLLSATVRRDGSSAFGPEERFGIFPAVSAGWMLSEESFLQNVAFVDMFKIRAGWGRMGNQTNVGFENQFNLYTTSPTTASYDIGGTNSTLAEGLLISSLANPAGRWETNETVNAGFDATLLNGTLDVNLDWYNKKTTDLLFRPELPAVVGVVGISPAVNIGSMKNSGIDLQIIKRGSVGELTYSADVIFQTYKNEITKIADNVPFFSNSIDGSGVGSSRIGSGFTRNQVGHSVSEFFGYEVEGLYQTVEEVNDPNHVQEGAGLGRFKYKDVDGNGVINPDDRTFFGNPNPDFTYGLTIKLGYKGFDFETSFYGVQGADIINYTRWFTDFYPGFPGAAMSNDALYNSWTPTNTGAKTPILENVSNFSTNKEANSYYMENGSYLRNRNLQIGYNLPAGIASKIGMERAKIYIQGTNLFTITKYKGLDPGVSGVDTNFGIDYGNYPVVRQFLVGLSLGL